MYHPPPFYQASQTRFFRSAKKHTSDYEDHEIEVFDTALLLCVRSSMYLAKSGQTQLYLEKDGGWVFVPVRRREETADGVFRSAKKHTSYQMPLGVLPIPRQTDTPTSVWQAGGWVFVPVRRREETADGDCLLYFAKPDWAEKKLTCRLAAYEDGFWEERGVSLS